MKPTAATLRRTLSYDTETGDWKWRISAGTRKEGAPAGNKRPEGYRYIKINRRLYRTSRLAWLYVTGAWPKFEIDHINGDPSDDRWSNLRPATHAQNSKNRKLNVNNSSGYKGVFLNKGRWRAVINSDGQRYHLGYFATQAEAAFAYRYAADQLHKDYCRQ
jgi:hypothetical protein